MSPVLFVYGALWALFSALQFLAHLQILSSNLLFFFPHLSCSFPLTRLHLSYSWSTSFSSLPKAEIISFMLISPLDYELGGRDSYLHRSYIKSLVFHTEVSFVGCSHWLISDIYLILLGKRLPIFINSKYWGYTRWCYLKTLDSKYGRWL